MVRDRANIIIVTKYEFMFGLSIYIVKCMTKTKSVQVLTLRDNSVAVTIPVERDWSIGGEQSTLSAIT